jgi:hypothetical protein
MSVRVSDPAVAHLLERLHAGHPIGIERRVVLACLANMMSLT